MPNTSRLVTANVLNTKISGDLDKIPEMSNLVTTNKSITKVNEVENKIPNHDKYITTPKLHKSTAQNFAARLKQTNLEIKIGFDNKLTSYNRQITSN